MTSSRSRTSISRWLALVVVLLGWAALVPSLAHAAAQAHRGARARGPKAEKFHADLVKLLKKTHTVVPVDKWNGTAEDLGATKLNDKNIKKVAKKLKIDGSISGKVDKRRDEYILQLKVRAGRSGAIVGNRVDVKAESARIEGSATRDLKDELFAGDRRRRFDPWGRQR